MIGACSALSWVSDSSVSLDLKQKVKLTVWGDPKLFRRQRIKSR